MKPSGLGASAWRVTLLALVALTASLFAAPEWPARAAPGNHLPVAYAGADRTVEVGDTVGLDGSESTDADGDSLSFHWSFTSRPPGSAATLSDPQAVRPTFQADLPGNYVIQLVVNDGHGNSAPDAVTISTSNSAPVADAGPDQTAGKGATVTLDGSRSFDADGDPLTYAWSFVSRPHGSAASLGNAGSIDPSFVADKKGVYIVQLIVNDGHADSVADAVTISAKSPTPVAKAGPNQTASVGETIVLDGSASTDAGGLPLTYSWSVIARPVGSNAALTQPASVRAHFTIDKAGDYVAQLIVRDGKLSSQPATVTISTGNTAPVARAGRGGIAPVGDLVQLDGGGSTDVNGDPLAFVWSMLSRPPQSAASLSSRFTVNPTFGIDAPGSYVLQLIVDDGALPSAPDTLVISTSSRPPVAQIGANQAVKVGATVHLDGGASSDPDGQALTFDWSLLSKPAGSRAKLSDIHLAKPTFVADVAGDYVAQLVVSASAPAALGEKRKGHGKGAKATRESDPVTTLVSTANSAPVADPGPDQDVATGSTVHLDGSASFDPDGSALLFAWSLTVVPPGSGAALSNRGIQNPTFIADAAGAYVAQLIVGDGLLLSDPRTVEIVAGGQAANQAPQVDAGSDQTITFPSSAAFNGTASDDGLPNPPAKLTVTWSVVSGPGTVTFGDVHALVTNASFSATGVYVLRLTADDSALTSHDDVQITVNAAANQPPVTHDDSAATAIGIAIPINVLANDSDPNGDTLSVSAFTQGANGSVSCTVGGQCTYTPNAGFSGSDAFTYTADDGHGGQTVGHVAVTIAPSDVTPTPVSPSVTTTVANSTQFLYSGPNAVQTGVAPGTIATVRAAVLRGRVVMRDGSALSGAAITILGHPEFGQTASRADGRYDMAVNGGGTLTINYVAPGFLPAQRQVNVPWQDYVVLSDVVLQALDGQATSIAANAPVMQVHRGSMSSDADGNRRATALFPAGTAATMVMPDGSMQPLSSLTVRATEFTVGANGKKAMPASLPPTSAYTYAVSFSVDEAVAAGAQSVVFSQPVIQYAENFLNFPVGTPVPTGVYDAQKAAWIPVPDGRVIKILSVTAGLADVDSDGDGVADNALGMSSDERRNLATLYAPGQTLWRTPLPHFSYVDNNWGFIPTDSTPPTDAGPVNDDPLQDPQTCHGCIIEMENQALGERVPIVGTPFSLNYRSDREPGHLRERTIQLSGATLSPNLASIGLTLSIAGRTFEQSFGPGPNQSFRFVWDGKDGYGRTLQGGQPLTGSIDYHYPAAYAANAAAAGPTFGAPPAPNAVLLEGFRDGTYATSRTISAIVGEGLTDARALGLGGWTLSAHHFFDPVARVVHMGDGTRRRADSLSRVINTVVTGPANGSASSLGGTSFAVAPDGSIYFLRQRSNFTYAVNKLSPDGIETVVAGNGNNLTPPFGDDGPAINASEIGPPLALGPDGSIYVQSNDVIRRIGPDGIIRRFAGRYPVQVGGSLFSACDVLVGVDGVPATDTDLCPIFYTVAPDGSVYISERHEGGCDVGGCTPEFARVRRVGADGTINTVAGTTAGVCDDFLNNGDCDDGAPAIGARLGGVGPLQIGADGTLYLADFDRIKRIGPDGFIHTLATGMRCVNFIGTQSIALGADGAIYASNPCGQIVQVTLDGTVTTFAGTLANPNNGSGDFVRKGDGGPALTAGLGTVDTLAVAPDGTIVLSSNGHLANPDGTLIPGSLATSIRRIGTFLPGVSTGEFTVASEDGAQLYIFDANGLHLQTLDALTGATLYEFAYDANGLLSQITQKTGGTDNVTTIEHDANGNPTAIVGPFGQRTVLGVDGNGFLASIANPAGETIHMTSDANGLMSAYSDARGKTTTYSYDADGHLVHETDPVGGGWTLSRTVTPPGTVLVDATTALGRASTYQTDNLAGNVQQRTITGPDGSQAQSTETIDAGTVHATSSDGMSVDTVREPDPRFGMEAPVFKSVVIASPGGLSLATSSSLTAQLANSSDPLSVISLSEVSTLNGQTTNSTYTASTRTIASTSPGGRTTTSTIDLLGRLVSTQLASQEPTSITYDSRGRLSTMTRGSGANARTVTFGYDASGFLQSTQDPLGRLTQFTRDAAGRVLTKTFADGRVAHFGYDAAGNLTSIAPPGRSAHTFAYSDRNELMASSPPSVAGTGPTGFTYDLDRAVTTMAQPDGATVTLAYDTFGRVATRTIVLNGVGQPADAFAYDSAGRLSSIATGAGETTSFSYDGLLPVGKSWSGQVGGSVARTYDASFRIATESVNASSTIAYSYDADDLVVAAGPLAVSRDAQTGLVTGTSLGVVSTSTTISGLSEVTDYVASANGNTLLKESFVRDAAGRITQTIETIGATTDTYVYGYTTASDLASVAKNGVTVESYVYDDNGNRTSATVQGATSAASYDAQDRLSQYGTTAYTFDAAGFLTSRTSGGQLATYRYDALGNLLGVTLPSGTSISYVVDGNGRRVGKKVNGSLVKGFLYSDQLRIVAELDGSGALVSRFVYAGGGVPVAMIKAGVTFRILTDQVGSVRLVVDSTSGAVVQRMDYDAFGNVALDTNPGFQPFGFAGGLYDTDTGLVRFGLRDYDPSVGRWTAKDPAGFGAGDGNLYRYVSNDPINVRDSTGLDAWDFVSGFFESANAGAQMSNPVIAIDVLVDSAIRWGAVELGVDPTNPTFFGVTPPGYDHPPTLYEQLFRPPLTIADRTSADYSHGSTAGACLVGVIDIVGGIGTFVEGLDMAAVEGANNELAQQVADRAAQKAAQAAADAQPKLPTIEVIRPDGGGAGTSVLNKGAGGIFTGR